MQIVIDIPEKTINKIKDNAMFAGTIHSEILWDVTSAIVNSIPFQKICDRENSEIKNEVKDLSKRVETLEKQIKKDKEEQLKKLKAELDYAKFRCALPTIMNMMQYN